MTTSPSDRKVLMPSGTLKGVARHGERYWSERSLLDWLYGVRDSFEHGDSVPAHELVDNLIRQLNGMR